MLAQQQSVSPRNG